MQASPWNKQTSIVSQGYSKALQLSQNDSQITSISVPTQKAQNTSKTVQLSVRNSQTSTKTKKVVVRRTSNKQPSLKS